MRRAAAGFTLLEAVVALTILAFALLGAFGWMNTGLASLGRVRDLALEEAAVQQAVAELEQRDLAREPAGTLDWRDYRIDWRAEPLEPARRGRTGIGAPSAYLFTLFDVELAVAKGGRAIGAPRLRIVQYAPVADAEDAP